MDHHFREQEDFASKQGATQEAVKFEPICEQFPYSNDEFGKEILPFVRIAFLMCSRNWQEVEKNARNLLADEKLLLSLMEDMAAALERMETIVEIMRAGEARLLLTLERVASDFPRRGGS